MECIWVTLSALTLAFAFVSLTIIKSHKPHLPSLSISPPLFCPGNVACGGKGGGGEGANINSYLAYTFSFLLWMTTLSVPMQVRNPPFCHFSLSHTLLLGEGGGAGVPVACNSRTV